MLGETDEKKIKIIDELIKAVVESIVSISVAIQKKDQIKITDNPVKQQTVSRTIVCVGHTK